MYPFFDVRSPPLEVQAASYLAASVKIVSFSRTSMIIEKSACVCTTARTASGALNGFKDTKDLGGQKNNAQNGEE